MAKIWTTEPDYPESRMALYDEAQNWMDRFELREAKRLARLDPLLFELPKKGCQRFETTELSGQTS